MQGEISRYRDMQAPAKGIVSWQIWKHRRVSIIIFKQRYRMCFIQIRAAVAAGFVKRRYARAKA